MTAAGNDMLMIQRQTGQPGLPGGALPVPSGAMPDPLPSATPVHGRPAAIWEPLLQRLAADGISGPQVTALFAALPAEATQSPMGRKMKELYRRRFLPAPPPSGKPRQQYYKGVVTEANARTCADFIKANAAAFDEAQRRYGVPRHVAVALLFVETRLGRVLGDVKENAFYTLASMAVSRDPDDIRQWLPQLPGYEKHLGWLKETMPQRADWAYKETRALVEHMLRDQVPAEHLPGSIYGAVGLCQFMPSNITTYGADGDGDGRVDLFTIPDAVASLSCYLYKHGWRAGIDRKRQHALLMRYNKSTVYANTAALASRLPRGLTDLGGGRHAQFAFAQSVGEGGSQYALGSFPGAVGLDAPPFFRPAHRGIRRRSRGTGRARAHARGHQRPQPGRAQRQ